MGIKGANSNIWKNTSNEYYSRCRWSWAKKHEDDDDTIDFYIDTPSLIYYLYKQKTQNHGSKETETRMTLEKLVIDFVRNLFAPSSIIQHIYLVWDGVAHPFKRETQIQRMAETSYQCFQQYHHLKKQQQLDRNNLLNSLHSVLLEPRIRYHVSLFNTKNSNNLVSIIHAADEAEIFVGNLSKDYQQQHRNNIQMYESRKIAFLSDDSDTLAFLQNNNNPTTTTGIHHGLVWIPFQDLSVHDQNCWQITNGMIDDDHVMTSIAALAGCDYLLIPTKFQVVLHQAKQLILSSKIGGLRPKYQNNNKSTTPAHCIYTAVSRFVHHFYNQHRHNSNNSDWMSNMTLYLSSKKNYPKKMSTIPQDTLLSALRMIHEIYHPCHQSETVCNDTVLLHNDDEKINKSYLHVELQRVIYQQTFYCRPIVEGWNQTFIVYSTITHDDDQSIQKNKGKKSKNQRNIKKKNKKTKRKSNITNHKKESTLVDSNHLQNSINEENQSNLQQPGIQEIVNHDCKEDEGKKWINDKTRNLFQELYATYNCTSPNNNDKETICFLLENGTHWANPSFVTCRRISFALCLGMTKTQKERNGNEPYIISEYSCCRKFLGNNNHTMECREIQVPIQTLASYMISSDSDGEGRSSDLSNENSFLSVLFQDNHNEYKNDVDTSSTTSLKNIICDVLSLVLAGQGVIRKQYHCKQRRQEQKHGDHHNYGDCSQEKKMIFTWKKLYPSLSMKLRDQNIPPAYDIFYWTGLLLFSSSLTENVSEINNLHHDNATIWFLLLLHLPQNNGDCNEETTKNFDNNNVPLQNEKKSSSSYEMDLLNHMELSFHHMKLLIQAVSFQFDLKYHDEDHNYIYDILDQKLISFVLNKYDETLNPLSGANYDVWENVSTLQNLVDTLKMKVHRENERYSLQREYQQTCENDGKITNITNDHFNIVLDLLNNFMQIKTHLQDKLTTSGFQEVLNLPI